MVLSGVLRDRRNNISRSRRMFLVAQRPDRCRLELDNNVTVIVGRGVWAYRGDDDRFVQSKTAAAIPILSATESACEGIRLFSVDLFLRGDAAMRRPQIRVPEYRLVGHDYAGAGHAISSCGGCRLTRGRCESGSIKMIRPFGAGGWSRTERTRTCGTRSAWLICGLMICSLIDHSRGTYSTSAVQSRLRSRDDEARGRRTSGVAAGVAATESSVDDRAGRPGRSSDERDPQGVGSNATAKGARRCSGTIGWRSGRWRHGWRMKFRA